jgi:hypothetical protein
MNEILRGFLDWDVTNEDVFLTFDVYECFAESRGMRFQNRGSVNANVSQ